jgi:XTP/dITP diphosphohydrolase
MVGERHSCPYSFVHTRKRASLAQEEEGLMLLLVATYNPGKMREYRDLLASVTPDPVFPAELGVRLHVLENGSTYLQNAILKAAAHARSTGLVTLADDSGLEVDALDGAPGIHSARYASGGDADRAAALLYRLGDLPMERRTARFVCVVVIEVPGGTRYHTEGVCEGLIAREPRGSGGFGYDPVFYLPEHGCTMAQLHPETKNLVSHRALAVRAALPLLHRLMAPKTPSRETD